MNFCDIWNDDEQKQKMNAIKTVTVSGYHHRWYKYYGARNIFNRQLKYSGHRLCGRYIRWLDDGQSPTCLDHSVGTSPTTCTVFWSVGGIDVAVRVPCPVSAGRPCT